MSANGLTLEHPIRRGMPVEWAEELPVRLKQLRRQRDLTLDALANSTGLTKSYLSKIERGLSVPSLTTVLKLAPEDAKALVHELPYSEAEAQVKSAFSRNPTIFRGGIA